MTRSDFVVAVEDPRRADVTDLLERHLAFSRATTPREHSFALDLDALLDPAITLFTLRRDGELLGVGALKELDPRHAEIKSMHTAAEARRLGVARTLLDHLLTIAVARGYSRLSLETGTMEVFAAARALYAKAGFAPCGPFAGYVPSPYNTFMTRTLHGSTG